MKDSLPRGHPAEPPHCKGLQRWQLGKKFPLHSGVEQKVAPSYEHRLSTGIAVEVSREYCFSCAMQAGWHAPTCVKGL